MAKPEHTLQVDPQTIPTQDQDLINFTAASSAMHRFVSLDWVWVTKNQDGSIRYRIKATDGRIWDQSIIFAVPPHGDPLMTFDVSDAWRLSEFQMQRDVRLAVISLHVRYGLETLKINWL